MRLHDSVIRAHIRNPTERNLQVAVLPPGQVILSHFEASDQLNCFTLGALHLAQIVPQGFVASRRWTQCLDIGLAVKEPWWVGSKGSLCSTGRDVTRTALGTTISLLKPMVIPW